MISPYLRRPLRSLDEILTQDGDDSVAAAATKLSTQAPARARDSAGAETEKAIPSTR